MNVVVVGATGLVGQALVEQLLTDPDIAKVTALVRSPMKRVHEKLVQHQIDFEQLANFQDYIHGDAVFSCLGTTLKRAGSITAQRRVDLDYQVDIAKLAAKNKVKHYLLVSSSGADSTSRHAYLKMKGELEDCIKLLPFNRITLLQPSLLLGTRDHFRLGEKLASYIMPVITIFPGLKKFQAIEGEEVAARLVHQAKHQIEQIKTIALDEVFM